MKILAFVLLVTLSVLMVSCKEQKSESQEKAPAPVQTPAPQASPDSVDNNTHHVEVLEVIQGNSYTYLHVKEGEADFWMATAKQKMEVGKTFSFANGLELKQFTSKELQRTFDVIFFVDKVDTGASVPQQPVHGASSPKPAIDKTEISIEPVEGGISLHELFSNKEKYAQKSVLVKGQVTKYTPAILGKNWVHISDGSGKDQQPYDLTITTQDEVAIGDVVTFAGTINLNKDFGAGYAYEVIMEDATLKQ